MSIFFGDSLYFFRFLISHPMPLLCSIWVSIQEYMKEISDADLVNKEIELPSKEKMTLGVAIINAPVKWLAAYRMELFLYLKINGHSNLSTNEAWSLLSVNSN